MPKLCLVYPTTMGLKCPHQHRHRECIKKIKLKEFPANMSTSWNNRATSLILLKGNLLLQTYALITVGAVNSGGSLWSPRFWWTDGNIRRQERQMFLQVKTPLPLKSKLNNNILTCIESGFSSKAAANASPAAMRTL